MYTAVNTEQGFFLLSAVTILGAFISRSLQ